MQYSNSVNLEQVGLETNNNDSNFESRNGMVPSPEAKEQTVPEGITGNVALSESKQDALSSASSGWRLEKSCTLLKKKLLCFDDVL